MESHDDFQPYSKEEILQILQENSEDSSEWKELDRCAQKNRKVQELVWQVQSELEENLPPLQPESRIWIEAPLEQFCRRKKGLTLSRSKRWKKVLLVAASLLIVAGLFLKFFPKSPRTNQVAQNHGLFQCGENYTYMSGAYKSSSPTLPVKKKGLQLVRTFSAFCQCGALQYKIREYRDKKNGRVFFVIVEKEKNKNHPQK